MASQAAGLIRLATSGGNTPATVSAGQVPISCT